MAAFESDRRRLDQSPLDESELDAKQYPRAIDGQPDPELREEQFGLPHP